MILNEQVPLSVLTTLGPMSKLCHKFKKEKATQKLEDKIVNYFDFDEACLL